MDIENDINMLKTGWYWYHGEDKNYLRPVYINTAKDLAIIEDGSKLAIDYLHGFTLIRSVMPTYETEPVSPPKAYIQDFLNDTRFDADVNALPDALADKIYSRVIERTADRDDWKLACQNLDEDIASLQDRLTAAEIKILESDSIKAAEEKYGVEYLPHLEQQVIDLTAERDQYKQALEQRQPKFQILGDSIIENGVHTLVKYDKDNNPVSVEVDGVMQGFGTNDFADGVKLPSVEALRESLKNYDGIKKLAPKQSVEISRETLEFWRNDLSLHGVGDIDTAKDLDAFIDSLPPLKDE